MEARVGSTQVKLKYRKTLSANMWKLWDNVTMKQPTGKTIGEVQGQKLKGSGRIDGLDRAGKDGMVTDKGRHSGAAC